MADLGISQSYFSCYKYPESELVRITKVVVFFTTNPTKLVLKFSEFPTNCYEFYKFLQICNTIEVTALRRGPWKFLQICNHALTLHKTPLKNHKPCNIVPGTGQRRSGKFRRTGGRNRPGAGGDRPSGPWGRFLGSVGQGEGRRGGVPVASGGGRRDRCTGGRGLDAGV
jgi:hypothetical protein